MKIIEDYEISCQSILKAFSKKQSLECDGWVAENIGGIASFNCQYYFSIDDMVLDLKTKQKKGFILQWQSEGVEHALSNKDYTNINYYSYIKGLRYKDLQ